MELWQTILIWVVVIGLALFGLHIWGKRLKKRYDEQQQLINQYKQTVQIFVIDKKKDKPENLKLPKQIKEQIPKMYQKRKMPVIIAKIGSQIQTLMCDENVYNNIPIKKQVKVEMAGVLVVGIVSGKLAQPEKVGFKQKMQTKLKNIQSKNDKE